MNPNVLDQNLYPDAAQRIMNLIKSTFAADQFTYYLGLPDNLVLASDGYPYCIVDKQDGKLKVGPTTADDITEHVIIHVIFDIKAGLGAPDTDNFVKRQLQTIVEGRNPTTGYFLPQTFMYALRSHLTLSSSSVPGVITINNDISISYQSSSVDKDNPEMRVALIDVQVTERQIVPARPEFVT